MARKASTNGGEAVAAEKPKRAQIPNWVRNSINDAFASHDELSPDSDKVAAEKKRLTTYINDLLKQIPA